MKLVAEKENGDTKRSETALMEWKVSLLDDIKCQRFSDVNNESDLEEGNED